MSSSTMGHLTIARRPRAVLAALALTVALASGCNEPPAAVTPAPGGGATAGPNGSGALQIGLAVPPNFQIDTVTYQIAKPGFSQSGTLDVTRSGAITATLGGIPAGAGYTLTLTATDVGKKLTGCSGSAPFAVTAGAAMPVSVDITCHLPQSTVVISPQVPIPLPAVALLGAALLYAGTSANGRRRRGARPPASPAPPT
jgi:hypothetical protein